MKRKYFIAFIIALIIFIYFYFGSNFVDDRKMKYDEVFYSTNIYGKLNEIDQYAHGCRIKVEGTKEIFVFFPNVSEISGRSFRNLAKPNDLVIKPSYSDTLLLIHDGEKYYFTFRLTK